MGRAGGRSAERTHPLIGLEDFDVLNGPKALGIPETSKLILVGDAEAFFYPSPFPSSNITQCSI